MGAKRRFGLRYHLDFSQNFGQRDVAYLGLGMDALVSLYEKKDFIFGLFGGFELAVQRWARVAGVAQEFSAKIQYQGGLLQGQSTTFTSEQGALNFQLPISLGLRVKKHLVSVEFGAFFP
ncbi:hypothetical protein NHP190003_14360 [Helicobacter sp. NHP19-003]|uniref:Outer membrane protein n=1 Tax=Helicobacter gastrocanis TaxID=2849641 RepID=A0ABM7SBW7_9HELI|nr:outer membrane beta-barrel protein [Helicobacter sp. NHP19-003]BCZ18154.1 hypothetical protein NHP190003_14360 [Helicobacter sp. NHP19-003]